MYLKLTDQMKFTNITQCIEESLYKLRKENEAEIEKDIRRHDRLQAKNKKKIIEKQQKQMRPAKIDDFIDEINNIISALNDKDLQSEELFIVLGNQTKANRQKFQHRREVLKQKVEQLNKSGFTASLIGGEIVAQTQKQYDLPSFKGPKESFGRVQAKNLQSRLVRTFDRIKDEVSSTDKFKQIVGAGFNSKIQIKKGNKVFELDKDTDSKKLANEVMGDPELYALNSDGTKSSISASFSTGRIGMTNKQKKNLDFVIISPNTKTRCIPDSLAIIDFIKKGEHQVNIFASVKENSEKIARKLNLVNGGTMADINKIVEINKIPIYQVGENVEEVGLMVVNRHCVVVCPKEQQYIEIAEQLQKQYYAQKDQLIRFDPKSLTYEGKIKRRDIVYIAYDFEWTYKQSQLLEKENKVVDQFPYAYSVWIFSRSDSSINVPAEKQKGLNAPELFVARLLEICQEFSDHDLVFYAHNGQKADYPLIAKLLPRHFKKDNSDFSSKMSTLSYNWNIGEQRIQFQDSMNLFPGMSLDTTCKTYGCAIKKGKCDHNAINLENWEEQFESQQIDEYICNDVLSLGQSILKYNEIIKEKYGFEILGKNNILSNSSLAQKNYFSMYYKNDIYLIPEEYFGSIFETYHGGSVQLFIRGHFNNQKVFAIDINSSYPGQMVKQLFPTGPYYQQDFPFIKFSGQNIPMGVYQIFIKKGPKTNFPVFFSKVDGTSQPSLLENVKLWTTSAEIKYAFECGYTEMYIISGIISRNIGSPFKEFITDHYAERLANKKMLKLHKKYTDAWCKYEALQLLSKNMMNSSYGKFALNISREIHELTTNEDLIMHMLQGGNISELREVQIGDQKFFEIGGVQEQKSQTTNIMLASFITAYGRIQLNQIQRDIEKYGFECIYSDTDSVYFRVNPNLNWSNKQINEAMQKLEQIHCDPVEIGKCKFETADDVGNCLKKYNEKIAENDEPLRYPFADEFVALALKTYALKSNFTGKTLLKGKGIPAWMIRQEDEETENKIEDEEEQEEDNRFQWNGNERQFVFDDFVKCADQNIPFSYNATQFAVVKKNMMKESASHLKEGKKMNKTVQCLYKQKNVTKTGHCKPKILRGDDQIDMDKIQKFQLDSNEDDYVVYSKFEEIKAEYKIEDDNEWKKFISQNNLIRNETDNTFILFKNFDCYKDFFNNVIKPIPIMKRNYHQINGPENQQFGIDVDIEQQDLEILSEDYGLTDEKINADVLTAVLRECFKIKDQEVEVIDRSRTGKKSFHVRFSTNTSIHYVNALQLFFKPEIDIQKNPESAKYTLIDYIDQAPFGRQLRITTQSDKFIFDPRNFVYQSQDLNKKQIQYIQDKSKVGEGRLSEKTDQNKQKEDKKTVEKYLKDKKLDKNFTFQKSEQSKYKKGTQIVNLFHIKGTEFNCPCCKRIHKNDNCNFLEIAFDNKTKKETINLNCYKYLQEKKFSK